MTDPVGSLRDEEAEETIREGLRFNDLRGKPLPRRFRVGGTTLESYMQAAGGGLSYMVRLRRIEDELARHERDAGLVRETLAAAYAGEPQRLRAVRRRIAEEWDLTVVNELIESHNRWYPAEANLPMDPRTGDYARVGGGSYARTPLDPSWILDRI